MRVAAIFVTVALVLGACADGGNGVGDDAPTDDPLGVIDALSSAPSADLVAWEVCGNDSAAVGVFDLDASIGYATSATRQPTESEPNGFQIRHRQLAGHGIELFEQVHYERTRFGDSRSDWREPYGYPAPGSPVPANLTTIDGVLGELGLDRSDAETIVEREASFLRFESLPTSFDDAPVAGSSSIGNLALPERSVVWVLDVWADDDGGVQRLRAMTARGSWREFRFTEFAELPRAADIDRCPDDADSATDGWLGRGGWEPTLVVPLDVSLDPGGRPYDVAIPDGIEFRREVITEFVVPDGELRVADGIAIGVSINGMDPVEFQVVDFPVTDPDEGHTMVDIEMMYEQGRFTAPLGVRASIPGATVERWGDWEFAYGTDGGMGGLLTQSVIDTAQERGWDLDSQPVGFDDDLDAEYVAADLDGVDGDDYLTFTNGFGDGAFPMARGFDAGGDVVALVVWDNRYPWRLAVPDGDPPLTVALREAEFQRCMDDPSLVDLDGSCPSEL